MSHFLSKICCCILMKSIELSHQFCLESQENVCKHVKLGIETYMTTWLGTISSIQSTLRWCSDHCQMALRSVSTSDLLEHLVKQKWVVTTRGKQPMKFVVQQPNVSLKRILTHCVEQSWAGRRRLRQEILIANPQKIPGLIWSGLMRLCQNSSTYSCTSAHYSIMQKKMSAL